MPKLGADRTAAEELNERREHWLNPPEWVEPVEKRIDESDDFSDVSADARPLLRRSAIQAAAAEDPRPKNRTLTKLYTERLTWLKLAHEGLDRAVLAAYAAADPAGRWPEGLARRRRRPSPRRWAPALGRADIDGPGSVIQPVAYESFSHGPVGDHPTRAGLNRSSASGSPLSRATVNSC